MGGETIEKMHGVKIELFHSHKCTNHNICSLHEDYY